MEFHERLRQLRQENAFTQKEIAEQLHCGGTTVASYECGRNQPNIEVLKKLAVLFDVSTDYLIGITDVKKINTILENNKKELLEKINGFSEVEIKLLYEFIKFLEERR